MGVFTEDELRILLSSLVEKPTRKQAYKFIQWCERTRIDNVILERTLAGQLLTKIGPDGEPAYGGERNPESEHSSRPTCEGSPLKIDITDQEYRLLLNMLQIADWILHAHIVRPPDDKYTAVLQGFMALAKDHKCDDLVDYDEKQKRYEPTNECFRSEEIHGPIDEHDDHVFWDNLVDRLAKRDVMREVGLKEYAKLDRIERFRCLSKARKIYDEEFATHGLKRLELPKTGEGKKAGGKVKAAHGTLPP